MRIVIEKRLELADQGTSERRIEVERDDIDVPETILLVQKLVAALDREDAK